MAINMIYTIIVLVGIYYGIVTYIKTKSEMVIFGLLILLLSLGLEIRRMNEGNYAIDTTDFFWTSRDIARTILTILGFKLHLEHKKKIGN